MSAAYFRPATDSPAKQLDVQRLREDFPMFQVTKTWEMMNIAERAAEITRRNREAAGIKAGA